MRVPKRGCNLYNDPSTAIVTEFGLFILSKIIANAIQTGRGSLTKILICAFFSHMQKISLTYSNQSGSSVSDNIANIFDDTDVIVLKVKFKFIQNDSDIVHGLINGVTGEDKKNI